MTSPTLSVVRRAQKRIYDVFPSQRGAILLEGHHGFAARRKTDDIEVSATNLLSPRGGQIVRKTLRFESGTGAESGNRPRANSRSCNFTSVGGSSRARPSTSTACFSMNPARISNGLFMVC